MKYEKLPGKIIPHILVLIIKWIKTNLFYTTNIIVFLYGVVPMYIKYKGNILCDCLFTYTDSFLWPNESAMRLKLIKNIHIISAFGFLMVWMSIKMHKFQ